MKTPNILIITTDQQRFDTIQAAGNPHIRTPHLNWLLETGIHFTRCYSDSPVCVPARATLLTGKHYVNMEKGYGFFGELTTPRPDATLPAIMTRHGYQTKSIGKLHYLPERCNYGWEDTEILEDYYRTMAKNPQLGIPMDHGLGQNEMQPAISTVSESNSLTHWMVDQSIDFLETRDSTRPFLLHLGFSKPHPPFDPCLNYWTMYANAPVPDPIYGDWSKNPEKIPVDLMEPTHWLNGVDQFSPELIQDCRRAYYALITQIDYNLGLLFARLREMKLLDSTLILFTSDHGEMLGDHHMGAKTTFLEGSAHVPMIVRPPSANFDSRYQNLAGTRSNALVCLADIMTTCLESSHCPPPKEITLDGIDLIQAAQGKTQRNRLFGRCASFHCVIEGNYKYIYNHKLGSELLFNLSKDPREEKNLIKVKAEQKIRNRLRNALIERLTQDEHPAVKNGRLQTTRTPWDRNQIRKEGWPGYHHRAHTPSDLLH